MALQHHENYDGSGYPRGLKGQEIAEEARLVAIVDSFQAMMERKLYREDAKLPYEAMRELLSLSLSRYDPILLKSFLEVMSVYPVGSVVELNDKKIALVVSSTAGKPMRPCLLLLRDETGEKPSSLEFIHLFYSPQYYIVKALNPNEIGIQPLDEVALLLKESS